MTPSETLREIRTLCTSRIDLPEHSKRVSTLVSLFRELDADLCSGMVEPPTEWDHFGARRMRAALERITRAYGDTRSESCDEMVDAIAQGKQALAGTKTNKLAEGR